MKEIINHNTQFHKSMQYLLANLILESKFHL